jgi:hypothetical protein
MIARRLIRPSCSLFLPLCAAFVVLACGRPATEAECTEIVERIARLEAQARNPGRPEVEADAVKAAQARAKEDGTFKLCVGRRITDGALACVRSATTADAVEKCFD